MSRRAVAGRLGISEGTIGNWRAQGLEADAAGLYTIDAVLGFCEKHPELSAARRALLHNSAQSVGDTATPRHAEATRMVARAARRAAVDHLNALVVAARAHLEILEQLQLAYKEIDDALVELTAPATLND